MVPVPKYITFVLASSKMATVTKNEKNNNLLILLLLLLLSYKSVVRPSLEYACSVWDTYNKGEFDQIEIMQRRAAMSITYRQRNTSSFGHMLQHLNCCSLEDRRKDARLVMMYKIANENLVITKTDRLK